MSFGLSSEALVSRGSQVINAGLESGKSAIAYGTPPFEKAVTLTAQAASWGANNPLQLTCAAAGTAGVLVVTAPVLVSAPLLSTVGFTAGGIKAGSAAAVAHSYVGNVVAGGAIAIGQSAGAGGSGLALVNGAIQLGAAAMTVGSAGLSWAKAKL
ncbi:hypothetical protein PENANT_c003G01234 [Penicillium antarcticum]|uniref:Uncharacterized protein n=1 Tax=Penicillium antarcticum TaxID=416450 RepID=A0A1V6QHL2_9EURO|nr:uncharacterized protein N7508_005918 [Penicillium antarcticum]KAJ5306903.1 hypothetical protein N7508_005918 [Penicillium antarcticum]OQD88693.1 hypothetical protein PENANT_c003G01234 [Penicillium antarcticum]